MSRVEKLVVTCVGIMGSKSELARFLGVTERSIYRWIAGQSKPSADYTIFMYDLVIKKGDSLK